MKQRKIIVLALFSSLLIMLLPINNVQALTGSFHLVTSKDNGDSYLGLFSNNQFIFVACGADGLRIYNKTSHNLLTTTYDSGYYNDVDVYDIWVFVAGGSVGLHSYRFVYNNDSDYSLTLNDTSYDAYVDDYYTVFADPNSGNVFCGVGGDGIYAYSYDYDTGALTPAGNQLDDDGSAGYKGITTDGSYIYTACGGDGLRAYIWDGAVFTLDDTIDDATDSYYDVIVGYDSNIYTAVGVNGTYVYSYAPGFNYVYNRTDSAGMRYTWLWLNDTVIYYSCQTEGLRAYLYYNTTSFQMDYLDVVHPVATTCIAVAGDEHYVYYSAYNAGLYTYTFNLTETIPITAPSIQTDPASGVTAISAQLNGQVIDDGGESCTVRFEWGTTLSYGNVTSNQTKTTGQLFNASLSGVLSPNTIYHFRAVGNNTNSTDNGADQMFTTLVKDPDITTNPATTISPTGATLNGIVTDDGGEQCQVWFEWGYTALYGNTTSNQYKTTGQTFSAVLGTLTQGETYHFRAVGNNSHDIDYGSDDLFTTGITAPTITTNPASGISMTGATLNGIVTDDGGETCYVSFEWGTTPAYGNTTITQYKTIGQSFSASLAGLLTPATVYHFRAVGNNTNTTDNGIDRIFTTSTTTTIPIITTNIATTILSTSATINGLVTDDGWETCYVWFQWGTTVGYGNTTTIQYKTTGQSFSIALSGLSPDTTYHFRAFGNNTNTTSYGIDRTFKTLTLHINVSWTHIFDDIGIMFTGGNHTLPNGTVIPVVGIFGGGMDTNALLGIFIFLILFVLTALFGMGMLVGSVVLIPTVFAVIGYIPELRIIVAIIVGILFGLGLNRLVRR